MTTKNTRTTDVQIHPTAIVHPGAKLAPGVQVGPFSIIDENVSIGEGTCIGARVSIEGYTTLGKNNSIFTGAVVGSVTQDKKYHGGKTYLKIGDNNKIREYVTINPATKDGESTLIGDGNLIMAYSHIAHDCIVKNNAVFANGATLAGHVEVDDGAIIGGLSGVHQFIRIGKLAIVGGCSKVTQDIPPFIMVDGHPATAFGVNKVGLERSGFTQEERNYARRAFKILFLQHRTLQNAIQTLKEELASGPILDALLNFLSATKHGICRPH